MIIVFDKLFSKLLKDYTGITLWPFIIVRHGIRKTGRRMFAQLINHERIHLRQQIECLLVFFYILYIVFYIANRIKGMNHIDAYHKIPFEQESYVYETDIMYLKNRKLFAWKKFV